MTDGATILLSGEPAKCALCGAPGHVHDDHGDEYACPCGCFVPLVAIIEWLATRGKVVVYSDEPAIPMRHHLAAIAGLTEGFTRGHSERIAELEEDLEAVSLERDILKAQLREYEPSDGMMHEILAHHQAIADAAEILGKLKAEEMIGLDDVNRWLALPVVAQARKAVKR